MTANLQQRSDAPSREPQQSNSAQGPRTANSTTVGSTPAIELDALLELLGDDYACDILCTLADGPTTARELTEEFEMSRPTVYRRLGRLQDAGIVTSRIQLHRGGHHRRTFHLVVDEIELHLHEDGIEGAVPSDTSTGN